jgi:biopolymer transport protein ExbB/TolQ
MLGSLGPVLGLLGTVVGLILAFMEMGCRPGWPCC